MENSYLQQTITIIKLLVQESFVANEETAVYSFQVDGAQKRDRAEQACKPQAFHWKLQKHLRSLEIQPILTRCLSH